MIEGEKCQIDVSIVIVSWNTCDLLEECLESIKEEAGDIVIEVIVVDNASSDGSADMVEKEFPSVRVIRNEENIGFAGASNHGIRESNGRYVLLLNPDTVILDGAVEKTVEFMDNETNAGIATCKVLNADRSFQICYGEQFPGLWMLITGGSSLRSAFKFLFSDSSISEYDIHRSHPVEWVMGAFMMIRREVVRQIGLLDESFFMYGEEPDYCYRARKYGWEMWYTNEGEIIHLGGESTNQIKQRSVIDWLMTNYFKFFTKHRSLFYLVCCYMVGLFSSITKTLLFLGINFLTEKEDKAKNQTDKMMEHALTVEWYLTKPLHVLGDWLSA
jgi:GT2 family glycosyltransferase